MSLKNYTYKIVKSGNKTEIYAYEDSLLKKLGSTDSQFSDNDVKIQGKLETNKENNDNFIRRKYDIALIKKKINRLINANVGRYEHTDKFLTLTFAGEPPTRETVVKSFKDFKRRFTYKYGKSFEYIAIIERGKEGTERLHMHMAVFNLPYIDVKVLYEIWQYGYIGIEKMYNVRNPAEYMTKYIEKTLEDNTIPKGKKFYFRSRGLYEPDEIYLNDDEMFEYLDNNDLGELQFKFPFSSTYVGNCTYTSYFKYNKDI